MTLDTARISDLLAQKKFGEARAIIQEAVKSPMTKAERGEALTKLVLAYLTLTNTIDADHRDALKQAIEALKSVDAAQASAKDHVTAEKLRAEMAK